MCGIFCLLSTESEYNSTLFQEIVSPTNYELNTIWNTIIYCHCHFSS